MLQPLPTGLAYGSWRLATIQVIIAAAGRQDGKAMDWVLQLERLTSVDEHDHPGGEWVSLYRMQAAAIAGIAHDEPGRRSRYDEQLRDERGADRTRSKTTSPCLRLLCVR